MKLYTLGLKRMGWPAPAGSIAYLEGPEIRDVDVTENTLQECQNKVIRLIEEILNRIFQARPSMFVFNVIMPRYVNGRRITND